jgi:hypothetical protein
MNGDIAEDPLARSVLSHLAKTRGKDDPLGSLARTVISGEATLRTAANNSWHSHGLAAAAQAAQDEQNRMTSEERAGYEQAARRLLTEETADDTEDTPGRNP